MGKRTKGQIHRDAVNSIVYRACGILRASIVQMEHACLEMGYPDASYGKNTEEEAESLVRHLLEALADESPSLLNRLLDKDRAMENKDLPALSSNENRSTCGECGWLIVCNEKMETVAGCKHYAPSVWFTLITVWLEIGSRPTRAAYCDNKWENEMGEEVFPVSWDSIYCIHGNLETECDRCLANWQFKYGGP